MGYPAVEAGIILKSEFEKLLGKNFVNILSVEKADGYAYGQITEDFIKAQSGGISKMCMRKYFSSENFLRIGTAVLTFILLFCFFKAPGYGVLTHEAIVDAAWEGTVVPLLKKKFPDAAPEDLIKAHAYAYGGAIMPDMGYFPFGNIFFTELLHYVRSGDFIMNLLSEARDLDEYAFALVCSSALHGRQGWSSGRR